MLPVLREKMLVQQKREKRQKNEGRRHTILAPGQRKANWAREDRCAHEQDIRPAC